MPRVRDLNPGFFLDDDLAELSPLHRLLFAGLWCLADREGILKDRPRKIKPQVLPYDECDVDAMLDDLHAGRFIYRYEVESVKCIGIPKFKRYQRVHWKEAESCLPPCMDEAWFKLESSNGHTWFKKDSTIPSGTGTGTGTDRCTSSKHETRPVDNVVDNVRSRRAGSNRRCGARC